MGRLANVTVSGVLVLGLAVAGCGSSSSKSSSTQAASASQTSSSQQTGTTQKTTPLGTEHGEGPAIPSGPKEHVPKNAIAVTSSAFTEGGPIPARYTCDGGSVSPPLHWSRAPGGTAELIVLISNFEGSVPGGGTPVSWALAGLQPTLTSIAAGTVPAGAVVGHNSFGKTGYTLCPPKGSPVQHYVVVVYALPRRLGSKPGFSASAVSQTAAHTAEYSGLAGFTYQR